MDLVLRFDDLTAACRALWAKSVNPRGHGLLAHMLDVAAVVETIMQRESFQTQEWAAKVFGLTEEAAPRWLAAMCGLHDFGKAIPGFQSKWLDGQKVDETAGLRFAPSVSLNAVRHDLAGAALLRSGLARHFPCASWIAAVTQAMGAHHGYFPRLMEMRDAKPIGEAHEWSAAREQLLDAYLATLRPGEVTTTAEIPLPAVAWLAGLTSIADWIGSNQDWFPPGERAETLAGHYAQALELAERALDDIGWPSFRLLLTENANTNTLLGRILGRTAETIVARPLQLAADRLLGNASGSVLMIGVPHVSGDEPINRTLNKESIVNVALKRKQPTIKMTTFSIRTNKCEQELKTLDSNSIECIVTDPPYGLSKQPDPVEVMKSWILGETYSHKSSGFMGKEWDSFVPSPSVWKEALRVLKPGGYALVFAGSRTQDWMAMSLRFAGFEIVDTIMWVYAQGMPKSYNIGKAISKLKGITEKDVDQWRGWGTQLKPAYEPILVCKKPNLSTFVENTMQYGVGGINIDACRIPVDPVIDASQLRTMNRNMRNCDNNGQSWGFSKRKGDTPQVVNKDGRWPANFAHDGSEQVMPLFPQSAGQQGALRGHSANRLSKNALGDMRPASDFEMRGDQGSAARFFFCAKTTTRERNLGVSRTSDGADIQNNHPTVKPIKLMRWLVKMVCPKGGTVLDMYCGSGSTGFAAIEEGFNFIGIEQDAKYASIAKARCTYASQLITGTESKRKKYRQRRQAMGRFLKWEQLTLFL